MQVTHMIQRLIQLLGPAQVAHFLTICVACWTISPNASKAAEEVNPIEVIASAREALGDPTLHPDKRAETEKLLLELASDSSDPDIKAQIQALLGSSKLFADSNLASAISHYKRARTLAEAGSPAWIEATFGLATATHHRLPVTPESVREAVSYFRELLQYDQSSDLAARSLMSIGRAHEVLDYDSDSQDLETAREIYEQVVQGWPETNVAYEASIRIGSIYIQGAYDPRETALRADWTGRLERMHTGIAHLRKLAETYPDHPLTPGVWEFIGNIYLLLPPSHAMKEQALRAYLNATGDRNLLDGAEPVMKKTNMDRIDAGYLYLRIASIAHQLGEREVAFEYYCLLISEASSYNRGPVAALQLTEHLGYTHEEIVANVRRQLLALGYEPVEVDRLIEDSAFLEPPVGVPLPRP